jgi:hypothetical protein
VRSKTSRSCAVIDFLLGFTSGLAIVKRQEVQVIHEDSPEGCTSVYISKRKIGLLSAVLKLMSYSF